MSQLLSRLEREMTSAADPHVRAELAAQVAAYMARVGEFTDAKARIAALREAFGHGESGRVTARIMLAEGLIHLYEDLSPMALIRITGAQALSLGMRYSTMASLASAWKAHIEFETSKFDAMVASLDIALANAGEADHDAHARISIVLSNSYMICGDVRTANRWFFRGRDHAVRNGDQASIEALLYNRATFGLAWLRVEHCDEASDPEKLRSARLEIQSARNLQELTGIAALSNHILLWEARLWILEERFEDAIERLRIIRTRSPFADYNFSQSFIDLEIAYCYLRSGDIEEAANAFQGFDPKSLDRLDIDEQIVAEWMRLRLSEADQRFGEIDAHRSRLSTLRTTFLGARSTLSQHLSRFST